MTYINLTGTLALKYQRFNYLRFVNFQDAMTTWPVIINGFGICYILSVCVFSRYRDHDYPLWVVHAPKIKNV